MAPKRYRTYESIVKAEIVFLRQLVIMASSLRNKDCLIGYSHRKSLANASKLPTKGVVLARFNSIQFRTKKGQHIDICREIFAELKVVWERAGIPIKADNTCVNDIKIYTTVGKQF